LKKKFWQEQVVKLVTKEGCLSIEVALTFDDLPGVDAPVITHILSTLHKHQLQGIYGFANGLPLQLNPAHIAMLHEWIAAGNFLANHTFSHLNLAQVTPEQYMADIKRNDDLLKSLAASPHKYFRYPFLDEGESHEKREQIRQFLFAQHYQIVPVTITIEEYRWNATFIDCLLKNNLDGLHLLKTNLVKHALDMLDIASEYAQLLFGRNVKHILLLHQTMFNAYILDDILTAYKNAGVKFITLPQALSEDFYHADPQVLGVEYFGFLGQLRAARKLNPTDKIRVATTNFMKRYADDYCSFLL
jgi:peptidoglycan-N-acetylglucosamine deacetylase